MDSVLIVIIGLMGFFTVVCIIGTFIVRHLNKTGR
jgi:hypothetical protein